MFFEQVLDGVFISFALALVALGLSLVYGILGFINFSHGELVMVGMYVAFFASCRMNFGYIPTVLIAGVGSGLIGVLTYIVAFRPLRRSDKINSLITSLGVSIFLSNLAIILTKGGEPINFTTPYLNHLMQLGSATFSFQRVIIVIISALFLLGFTLYIRISWTGKALRAVAQNFEASELMGINPLKMEAMAFFIAGLLAGVAGSLIAPLEVITPYVGLKLGLKAFAVVILAGFGNLGGILFASFVVGIGESLASGYLSASFQESVSFLIIVLVLLIRPYGIFRERVEENV